LIVRNHQSLNHLKEITSYCYYDVHTPYPTNLKPITITTHILITVTILMLITTTMLITVAIVMLIVSIMVETVYFHS